jgi:hypothetical protein
MSGRATPPDDATRTRSLGLRTKAEVAIAAAFAALETERLSLNQIADLIEGLPGARERHDVCEAGVRVAVVKFDDGSGVGIHERGLDHLMSARA